MITLNKLYIACPHIVEGIKRTEGGNGISESSSTLRLIPGLCSVLFNCQKIKIERKSIKRERNTTPYKQFISESASILNHYELEFDSNKTPFRIVDHSRIWKEWQTLSVVLLSKYEGAEVEHELGYMTSILGDEKKLLKMILNDYIIKELYGRELLKMKFNKDYKQHREWYETAFSEDLLFSQVYSFYFTNHEDQLQIKGFADLNRNKNSINRICRRYDILFEHITSIEQETTYSGYSLARMPDNIETKYFIKAKDECIRLETTTLTIKKDE